MVSDQPGFGLDSITFYSWVPYSWRIEMISCFPMFTYQFMPVAQRTFSWWPRLFWCAAAKSCVLWLLVGMRYPCSKGSHCNWNQLVHFSIRMEGTERKIPRKTACRFSAPNSGKEQPLISQRNQDRGKNMSCIQEKNGQYMGVTYSTSIDVTPN